MNRYVPLSKRTKRAQREYFAGQRRDWDEVNSVTKRPPNSKAYDRKKTGRWGGNEPLPGFLFAKNLLTYSY